MRGEEGEEVTINLAVFGEVRKRAGTRDVRRVRTEEDVIAGDAADDGAEMESSSLERRVVVGEGGHEDEEVTLDGEWTEERLEGGAGERGE